MTALDKRGLALRKRRKAMVTLFGGTVPRTGVILDRELDSATLRAMASYVQRHTGEHLYGALIDDYEPGPIDDLMASVVEGFTQLTTAAHVVYERYGCDPAVDCVPTHVEELLALARAGQDQEERQP